MNRGVYDRSETDRLGHALLPLLREISPGIHPHSHPNWLSNLDDLLLDLHPILSDSGFRCTHSVVKCNGVIRHLVIFSNRTGDLFEGAAHTANLATARAAEHLLLSGKLGDRDRNTPHVTSSRVHVERQHNGGL